MPYWNAFTAEFSAVGDGQIFVANNMVYPMYRYTMEGEVVDSFGTPPPSWIDAYRPERGEFMGPGAIQKYEKWIRTFTSIDDLGVYGDSLLLVSHMKLNPEELRYWDASYKLDVYTTDGDKRYEDVELPGQFLYADDYVYVLVDSPPGPWTIGKYRLRRPETVE